MSTSLVQLSIQQMNEFYGLPARIQKVLSMLEFNTKEEVFACILSGSLEKRRWIGPKYYEQICNWIGIEKTKQKPSELDGLSSRVKNVCSQKGIYTREQLMQEIITGRLHPSTKQRNYGIKSHIEVIKWLGLTVKTCPHCNRFIQ